MSIGLICLLDFADSIGWQVSFMPKKRWILTDARLSPSLRAGLVTSSTILLLFGMVAAFGTASNTVIYSGHLTEVLEQIATPAVQPIESNIDTHVREARIEQGDTVYSLLARMSIRDKVAVDFLRNNRESEVLFRQLAPGKTLTASVTAAGDLLSLTFPLNNGNNTALLVQHAPQGFEAKIEDIASFESSVSLQSAVIRHSLFGAADEAGIPDSIAIQLTDIFGGDIDFHRDLRKGDRFSVIYESARHIGKTARTGRILAAEFINNGKTYRAFWHQDNKNDLGGYYTADGNSVKKSFLRSPLEFSRITSGFSNARYHPVMHEMRAHRGIDYGAPTGTRVKATGDGTVEFAGTQGGYGKIVTIRHSGDKTTAYGHLSGFANGIRKGARVSQGETIGFVGSTGMATGPHLHYEFRAGGIHRNPLTVALPGGAHLVPTQMAAFKMRTGDFMSQIASIRDVKLVLLD